MRKKRKKGKEKNRDNDAQKLKVNVKQKRPFTTGHKKSPNSIAGNPGRMKGGVVPLGVEPRTHGFSVHCSTTWAKAPSFFTNGRNRLYLVFESECKDTLFSSISRIFFHCLITINEYRMILTLKHRATGNSFLILQSFHSTQIMIDIVKRKR